MTAAVVPVEIVALGLQPVAPPAEAVATVPHALAIAAALVDSETVIPAVLGSAPRPVACDGLAGAEPPAPAAVEPAPRLFGAVFAVPISVVAVFPALEV